ncbi:hypothetical protein [Algoriphagus boritolerans]|uniref:hypothetical protein n=1 Tax=Algoriphagus boritolerans TaxID=308111 RepID=UPI002FCE174C
MQIFRGRRKVKKTRTRTSAIHVIQGERFGNSNWQMGQMDAWSSISIAQEGHSLVFTA